MQERISLKQSAWFAVLWKLLERSQAYVARIELKNIYPFHTTYFIKYRYMDSPPTIAEAYIDKLT